MYTFMYMYAQIYTYTYVYIHIFLNYRNSVIKDKFFVNGHFKQSNEATNDSWTYFDMIKAVADERAHPGLTNNKELVICISLDYIAFTNVLTIDLCCFYYFVRNSLVASRFFLFFRFVNIGFFADLFLCARSLTKPFFRPSQPGSCAWLSPFFLCADCTCVLVCVCLCMCM